MKCRLAFFDYLPWGTRLLAYVFLSLLLADTLGKLSHLYSLSAWLGLVPVQFWHGRIWTILTHAYLPASLADLAFNGFFLLWAGRTLEKFWSGRELLLYTLVCAAGSGSGLVLLFSGQGMLMCGLQNLVMGLLVAWGRLLGHDRVTLPGGLDLSVRQIVFGLGFILSLLVFMAQGKFGLVALTGAGASGWLFFFLRWRWMMATSSQAACTQRIRKLEL